MLGGLSPQNDIDIFLTQKEIEELISQNLEGTIVKRREPKIQNPLILSINEEKSRGRIGVEEQGGTYQVFISQEYFKMLREDGSVGTRYNTLGDNIDIVEKSRAKEMDDFRFELRLLRTYVEHREKPEVKLQALLQSSFVS